MNEKKSILRKIVDYKQFGLLLALAVLLVIAAIVTPSFFSFMSISSMLTNNAVYAILTIGIMFVLLAGGIDLSIGAILAVSGVSVTLLMNANQAVPAILWVFLAVVIGGLCGLFNGLLVGKLRMVPMIVTLGTMYIFRGLAFVISNGAWFFPHHFTESFMAFSQFKILGFSAIVWWMIGLFVVAGFFLAFTRSGRRLYAIGTSPESSKVAGINEGNVKVMSFVLCGACAGLAGVLYSANYAMVNSDIGTGYELTAIATCILGGVSISGGRGRIDGVIISVILMAVISYLLSLLPGFSVWQSALQGAIIIIAVVINLASASMVEKRALKERGMLI